VDYSEEVKESDEVDEDEVQKCFGCGWECPSVEGPDNEYGLCEDCLPLGW
jgi:hypothetical protein